MKAILVIDMPNECDECPCLNRNLWQCQADIKRRSSDERPDWCPLKLMPMKVRTDEDDIEVDSYWQGWNDCIEGLEKPETKSDLSTDEGWWRDYELYEMQND